MFCFVMLLLHFVLSMCFLGGICFPPFLFCDASVVVDLFIFLCFPPLLFCYASFAVLLLFVFVCFYVSPPPVYIVVLLFQLFFSHAFSVFPDFVLCIWFTCLSTMFVFRLACFPLVFCYASVFALCFKKCLGVFPPHACYVMFMFFFACRSPLSVW